MNRSDGSTADYYVLPEGATQLQDLISHRNMNAQIGEIIRACYRYGMASHSDMLRDAKKIRFYAQAEVERLEKLEAASEQCGQVEDSEASVFGSWIEGNILRYRGESSEFYTQGATYKILAIKGQYMYVEDDSEDNKHGWTLIPAMENFTYYAQ